MADGQYFLKITPIINDTCYKILIEKTNGNNPFLPPHKKNVLNGSDKKCSCTEKQRQLLSGWAPFASV